MIRFHFPRCSGTLQVLMLLLLALIAAVACNEKIYTGDVNCDECYTEKPEKADLVLEVTLNNIFTVVPIEVFEGEVEDNQLVYSDTAYASPFFVYVPANKKYTVKATYRKDEKTLHVINTTKLKVLLVTDACDENCYVIENENVDVQIKDEFKDF
ncbi:MAG: hypothetical protein JXQ80_05770 [Bacteroidales bacterium]|nr:hypothetical protein [Bacteroidales bacterium]